MTVVVIIGYHSLLMDKLLQNDFPSSTFHKAIYNKVLLYQICNQIWIETKKLAYYSCEACLNPNRIFAHTCLHIWNETQLLDNGWAKHFTEKYFKDALNNVSWKKIQLYMERYNHLNRDNRKCNKMFWITRSRRLFLQKTLLSSLNNIVKEEEQFYIQV